MDPAIIGIINLALIGLTAVVSFTAGAFFTYLYIQNH